MIKTQPTHYQYRYIATPKERFGWWFLGLLILFVNAVFLPVLLLMQGHEYQWVIAGFLVLWDAFMLANLYFTLIRNGCRRAGFLRGRSHYEISSTHVATINEKGERFEQYSEGMNARVKQRRKTADIHMKRGLGARMRYEWGAPLRRVLQADGGDHPKTIVLKDVADADQVAEAINALATQ